MSSNTNCSKQRKEIWNLVNFLYLQVSYITMTCMLITVLWKNRSLEKYCGIMDSDQLSMYWWQEPPDREMILEFMACKCNKICKLPSCQCLVNNFKCQLQIYENMDQDEENANLSGMEGLGDHTEDTYPKWDVGIFLIKVSICNVYCVSATALIFDTRTGVLVKVLSKFLRQKMSWPDIFLGSIVSTSYTYKVMTCA